MVDWLQDRAKRRAAEKAVPASRGPKLGRPTPIKAGTPAPRAPLDKATIQQRLYGGKK